jgi:hypothetical protein
MIFYDECETKCRTLIITIYVILIEYACYSKELNRKKTKNKKKHIVGKFPKFIAMK